MADAPARTWDAWMWAQLIRRLDEAGYVIVRKHKPVPGQGLNAQAKERFLKSQEGE